MRCLLLLVGLSAVSVLGCPAQQPKPEPRFEPGPSRPVPVKLTRKEKLTKLLSGKKLPTERRLRALGSGIDSDMVDIINNRRASQVLRLRALYCMGYFQNRRAHLLLRTVLTDPNWDKPYRIAALSSIARSIGVESYSTVKDYTLDPDSDMRQAAVEALSVIGTQEALSLLKTLQLRESNSDVLDAIDKAIRKLSRNPLEGR